MDTDLASVNPLYLHFGRTPKSIQAGFLLPGGAMARISIDEDFFSDPRVFRLMELSGDSLHLTYGRLVALFKFCYDQKNSVIMNPKIIGPICGHDGAYHELLLASGLATKDRSGFVKVRGVDERIAYLIEHKKRCKNGGIKSGQTRRKTKDNNMIRGEVHTSEVNNEVPTLNPIPIPIPIPSPIPTPTPKKDKIQNTGSSRSPNGGGDAGGGSLDLKLEQTTKWKEGTPGSYAFECYAKHYEARYKIRPLRSARANTITKRMAAAMPAEDLDGFFKCYLANTTAYYLTQTHPLWLAEKDMQKIHTELLTGANFSQANAKQYELADNNRKAAEAYLQRKHGVTGNESK